MATHLITKENAKELGRKGGKQRAINAKRAKSFKDMAAALLLEKDPDGLTQIYKIVKTMIEAAKNGDIKAATFLRDTTEGKPKECIKADIKTMEAPQIIFDIPKPPDSDLIE